VIQARSRLRDLAAKFQWRNRGGRRGGQLPPGAAGKGAQNSLAKVFYD